MKTYYELLNIKPMATPLQVTAAFRQYAARVRPASPVEQVFGDQQFRDRLNAYLVLSGDRRERYDALLRTASADHAPAIDAVTNLDDAERRTWMARIAMWREEPGEALHVLRDVLERHPHHAPAWALMGEVYFLVDRVADGAQAYERALRHGHDNADYAARLQHARDVLAGKCLLRVELSPEQEMRIAERKARWRTTTAIVLLGLVFIALAYYPPLAAGDVERFRESLWVPWPRVAKIALGAFFIIGALAFGRIIPTFDRSLMGGSMVVAMRGSIRSYPYALLILATGAVSLWLAAAVVLVMAFMDEEWPAGPSLLVGLCMVLDLLLVLAVYTHVPAHWTGAFFVGGNAMVLAGLLGWWAGSIGAPME